MQAKTKLIASIVAVSLIAVFSVVGLVLVLAAYTVNLSNSYNITYTASGVACDVSSSYRKATIGETSAGSYTTIMAGANSKITFTGKDTSVGGTGTYSASFNQLSNQAITKNQYFVLRYIIQNNKSNSIDMVVNLNITTSTTPINFTVSYAYSTNNTDLSTNLTTNRNSFKQSFNAKQLNAGSTAYIYVLFEITNLDIDASFVGTANWELIDANEYVAPPVSYANIKSGKYVNSAIKGYANIDTKYYTRDSSVRSISFGNLSDYGNVVSSVNNPIDISSANNGSVMVYRVANGSLYDAYILATEDNTKFKFNSDSSYMFAYFGECESIEFNDMVSTSSVTDMNYMFGYSYRLTSLDVSNFDTSSVTDMGGMFCGCYELSNLDVSNFDTSSVTTMGVMFSDCYDLSNLDVSGWDTSKVTDMCGMFYKCMNLTTLDVTNWDTSKVTTMVNMFCDCSNLSVITGIENWDTSSLTSVTSMFYNCLAYNNIDFSGWDKSKITNFDRYIAMNPDD